MPYQVAMELAQWLKQEMLCGVGKQSTYHLFLYKNCWKSSWSYQQQSCNRQYV